MNPLVDICDLYSKKFPIPTYPAGTVWAGKGLLYGYIVLSNVCSRQAYSEHT
jgi:hypothetical protein